jgi:putative addiction module component (TIGR02574 family)
MSTAEVIEKALELKALDRLMLIELLQKSLDKPDAEIERVWVEEAKRRLEAYRAGRVQGIPAGEIFGDDLCTGQKLSR